ncbi:GIY-YIG nuclease family protein [Aeromonas jandaei]|uniref:GIY-YIG nuclease family protein n=1 Tax=Aeromonas jandaei TaxID=650 RepID=UPI001629C8F4|nr:GIY-YIG nuclease family protein [Aeromonas jandaei]QNF17202.1 GIY-YIG nuclease family protein [Aeromonas jandaei]WAG06528.1 GIY-YIG nuclease family protein [Aeromonas jandaei]
MRKPPTGAPASPSTPPSCWSIYMVRTAAGLLYTGISTAPERRLRQHQSGKGSRALRGKGPLTLVWQQEVGDKGAALRLEYRLKQQPKAFKEQLITRPDLWLPWSLRWLNPGNAEP